jgi:hypothetical protein
MVEKPGESLLKFEHTRWPEAAYMRAQRVFVQGVSSSWVCVKQYESNHLAGRVIDFQHAGPSGWICCRYDLSEPVAVAGAAARLPLAVSSRRMLSARLEPGPWILRG